MAKRKFSAERLYKLARNLIVLISFFLFIASAITFYIFKSAQNEINNIDNAVEFPRHYKELTFPSLDDFLNYVEPYYTSKYIATEYPRWRLPQTKEQIENEEKLKKKSGEILKLREELRQMIKLPNGFNSALQLKNHRKKLRNDINHFKAVSGGSLFSAIILQIVFWGIVWLYRYLFPLTEIKKE